MTTELKPPFDVEFPNSERQLSDHHERLIELGTHTPAMLGYRSITTGEIEVPLTSEDVHLAEKYGEEIDLLLDDAHARSVHLAEKYGGHPNDWNPNYY